MDTNKKINRTLDITRTKQLVEAIGKEENLRLQWFWKNEILLRYHISKEDSGEVLQGLKDDKNTAILNTFRNAKKNVRPKCEETVPDVDESKLMSVMKPVNPKTAKLIYTATEKDGRLKYFNERNKILPEDRYYFPETTYWGYGWKMWNHVKTMKDVRYGKQKVIATSFYRRRAGVEKDPDWYKEPA